ncbi:MAG: hypothetical protein R3D98_14380 [Candidatus Krumholzibacteriia bacterium]
MTASRQQPLRNAIHAATGLAAWWVLAVPEPWRMRGLVAMLTANLALDVVRWRGGRGRLDRALPGVYRDPEPLGVSCATLLAVGYLLATSLFPPPAAAAGILALALGDPAAAVVGRWYGARRALAGKTWPGSLACFLASFVAILLIPGLGLMPALAGAAMAALVERRAGPLDNVLVPVAVAMLAGLWVG